MNGSPAHPQRGMTLLEVMVVLAIIALLTYAAASGFRMVTKADLADDARELGFVIRRAQQLAMLTGDLHRVVLDLDTQAYQVEACKGSPTLVRQREERVAMTAEERAERMQDERDKLLQLGPDTLSADPAAAEQRAAALAGHHVLDRVCEPAQDMAMDAKGRGLARELRRSIAFGEIAVQHLDDVATKGSVTLNLMPSGAAEKAVLKLTDGDATFAVVVHGLTGRIEVTDDPPDAQKHLRRMSTGAEEMER